MIKTITKAAASNKVAKATIKNWFFAKLSVMYRNNTESLVLFIFYKDWTENEMNNSSDSLENYCSGLRVKNYRN